MTVGDTKTGFMCATNWRIELGEVTDGIDIYSTLEDFKAHCPCWKTCGVVEVEVKLRAVAIEGAH